MFAFETTDTALRVRARTAENNLRDALRHLHKLHTLFDFEKPPARGGEFKIEDPAATATAFQEAFTFLDEHYDLDNRKFPGGRASLATNVKITLKPAPALTQEPKAEEPPAPVFDPKTSYGRFWLRIQGFKSSYRWFPRTRHLFWWWLHNFIAHFFIGIAPVKATFWFHDWTSKHLNLADRM